MLFFFLYIASDRQYTLKFGFLEKLDKDHRIKDQGSVQNESNKLNKLIGMIYCSST